MKELGYFKRDARAILQLLREHSLLLLIVIISYLATYSMNVFLARLLKPIEYGDISVVLQLMVFFAPFALLGTEISLLRFIPKYLDHEDYAKISGFLRWIYKIFFQISLCVLALGAIISVISYFLDKAGFHRLDQYHLIFFSYWLIPLYALLVLQANLLQSLKNYFLSATFNGFLLSLIIIGSILLFLPIFENTWIGSYQRKYSIILCLGIGYLLICGFEFFTLRKKLPKQIFHAEPAYEIKRWRKSSFHMMLSTVIFASLMAIDIVMLDIFAKDEAMVGQFAAILTIASSLMVFSSAVDMIVTPIISPSVERGNTNHLQATLDLMNIFKSVPILIILILLIIFGKNLLVHFGQAFTEAYPSLIVLLIGFAWAVCFNSSGPLLLYSKHEKLSFYISFGQLLFIMIFDIIFIPIYGLMGAVVVLAASLVLSTIIRTYFCHKFLKIKVFFYY